MGLPVSGESATHNQSEDTDEPENPLRYFFTCANYCRGTERLQENEDHGLIVEGRGIVTIEGLTFYDGTHTLSGPVTVGGDLVVGDGTNAATLRPRGGDRGPLRVHRR